MRTVAKSADPYSADSGKELQSIQVVAGLPLEHRSTPIARDLEIDFSLLPGGHYLVVQNFRLHCSHFDDEIFWTSSHQEAIILQALK